MILTQNPVLVLWENKFKLRSLKSMGKRGKGKQIHIDWWGVWGLWMISHKMHVRLRQ